MVDWRYPGFDVTVPFKLIEYWVYGDLNIIYPKPCSSYLRGKGYFLNLQDLGFGCFRVLGA